MSSLTNDYETSVSQNGLLDYMLIAVHVPQQSHYDQLARQFQIEVKPNLDWLNHVNDMFREAGSHFSHHTLNLERTVQHGIDHELGEVVESYHGSLPKNYIEDFRENHRLKNTVLIGTTFGNCHRAAYRSLIESGVAEIHIPQDGTNGFNASWYENEDIQFTQRETDRENNFSFRVNPHLDVTKNKEFDEYVEIARERGNFQIIVPEKDEPITGKTPYGDPPTVYFHRSWREMMDSFQNTERN